MEKLKFKVRPTSIQGHSVIEWDDGSAGVAMRSLQVETEIAELWASVPEMKAKLQVAEEMAIALRTIGDLPQSLIGKSVQEYASRLYAAWEKAGKGEG